jgi:hypothetical protein
MMKEIALHLLDIAENSVSAQASAVEIMVCEDLHADRLEVQVKDNGKGMPPETARQLGDPFYTTRTTRKVGLGIPLFEAAAQACNGSLNVSSQPGMGTIIQIDFQYSHIDRMPLGDFPATCLALLIAHPEVNWRFIYRQRSPGSSQAQEYIFDDAPIKEILDGVPLCEPGVLGYLRQTLEEGVGAIASSAQSVRHSLIPN